MSQSDKRGKSDAKPLRRRKTGGVAPGRDTAPVNDVAEPTVDSILLNADMRVSAAKDLHAKLIGAGGRGELVLIANEVTRVDAAGIQALLAALSQISDSGHGWRWHNPSSTLTQGIELLGLKANLRLP